MECQWCGGRCKLVIIGDQFIADGNLVYYTALWCEHCLKEWNVTKNAMVLK